MIIFADLEIVVKHVAAGVAGRLLDQPPKQVVAEVNKAIECNDSMLRIITSPANPLIRSERTLPDRNLISGQTQHRNMMYAELSLLHKLKMRYATVFKRDLALLKVRLPFFVVPWWKPPQIIIARNDEEATVIHDAIITADTHLAIYIDGSDIDGQVRAPAVTLFTSVKVQPPIIADRRQAYLSPLTNYTVYSGELIGLDLAMRIAENQRISVTIFTDNQAAIRAIHSPKHQSGQYMLRDLAQKIINCGNTVQIHWIPAHVGVSENEAADMTAKEATGWKELGRHRQRRGSLAPIPNNLKILTSAMKTEIRTRAKKDWTQK